MRKMFVVIMLMLFAMGCSEEKADEKQAWSPPINPGPPRKFDVGDEVLENKLPEDVSDGFLSFGKAPGFSYGVLIAHNTVSPRYHERSDMLVYIHSGITRFHVGDENFWAAGGDVVYVPRGSTYAVTTREKYPLEFVTVYSPPFDPNDIVYPELEKPAPLVK
jgi:mannose-6-phosphate isomerase-like protein (cupin superfamily)